MTETGQGEDRKNREAVCSICGLPLAVALMDKTGNAVCWYWCRLCDGMSSADAAKHREKYLN